MSTKPVTTDQERKINDTELLATAIRKKRNEYPIVAFITRLAEENLIDWKNESIVMTEKTIPLSDLVGSLTAANLVTIRNKFNPMSDQERKINDAINRLKSLGFHEEANEVAAKWELKKAAGEVE